MEVYYNGEWGTVCNDNWDLYDAQVVCSELSYGATAMQAAVYGQSSRRIWLDNVNCVGTEDTIASCSHNNWGYHDCLYEKDANVKCSSGNFYSEL